MLNRMRPMRASALPPSAQQNGMVLLVALIILVVMTLAGLALTRAMMTSNMIAGNLAFHQAATSSADTGVEAAFTFLTGNSTGATLYTDNLAAGYVASVGSVAVPEPTATQSWDTYWNSALVVPNGNVTPVTTGVADAAGNQTAYVIQRLCNLPGQPNLGNVFCVQSPTAMQVGNSKDGGSPGINGPAQVYYRVTVRVTGPRNTISYVQSIIAI